MYKQGYSRNASQERQRHAHASSRPEPRPPRAQPKSEPAVLASAIRLKNFRQLHELVGEENLAMALELPLQRVRELHEGINFSDETTFHLENTLGLRSGYFDQVNPQLSDDEVKRLKSPLEHASPAERLPEPPTNQEIPVPHSAKVVAADTNQSKAVLALPAATGKAAKGSASKNPTPKQDVVPASSEEQQQSLIEQNDMQTQPVEATAPAAAPAAPKRRTRASGPIDTDELRRREVRRANLGLITEMPGSKSRLARLTGMSPANISHRLHGNKNFDEGDATFFGEKLNLPEGWFNEPHTEEDVPDNVMELLGGSPRSNVASNRGGRPSQRPRASTSAAQSAPAAPNAPANLEMPATSEAGLTLRHAGVSSASQATSELEPAMAGGMSLTGVRPAPSTRPQAAAIATATPEADAGPMVAAAPAVVPAVAPVTAAAPVATAAPAAAPSPVAAVLATLDASLNPIAEALIKTLALKARQGKLSEELAFKFLSEAMAL